MLKKIEHEYAVYLFEQGFFQDAARLFDEILREEESAELWSDWATAQFALSRYEQAERGFRRALELEPDLNEAVVNYGTLLAGLQRWPEAIEMFERVLPRLAPENRAAVSDLAEQCRAQQSQVDLASAVR